MLLILFSCVSNQSTKQHQINVDLVLDGLEIYENSDFFNKEGIRPNSYYNYYQEVLYDEGSLLVLWTLNEFYVSEDIRTDWRTNEIEGTRQFIKVFWKEKNGKYVEPTNHKWFSIGGNATSIEWVSSNEDKAKIYSDTSTGIYKEGSFSIILTFLEKKMAINFNVLVLPVRLKEIYRSGIKRTTSDEIISMWGLPDNRKKVSVSWPNQAIIDGIFYDPNAGSPETREHWRFKKYPDFIVSVIPHNGYITNFYCSRDKALYKNWKQ
jgi:hypothetical protein